jgi:class 3 adenylate cyclase
MSVAQGSQTLLTADARAALDKPAFPLSSHGHWRLKGVSEPHELFEALDKRRRVVRSSTR